VQPQTKPLRASSTAQHIGGGTARDILHSVAAQPAAVASDLDHDDARLVRKFGLENVAGAAECQTEHVETWPNIGNSGGCEHANSSISHGFADYRITISAMP
jgi:hypothetical protein